MKNIDINEIKNLEGIEIIDVREVEEYKQYHLENTTNIPMMGLMMNAGEFLDKSKTYYIMCAAGGRSMQVCMNLEEQGYDVVNLDGGIGSFKK